MNDSPPLNSTRTPSSWARCVLFATALTCMGCNAEQAQTPGYEQEHWRALQQMPAGNAGFIAGTVNDEVLILGGTNWVNGDKHWLSDAHAYSFIDNNWRQAPPLPIPTAYAAFAQNDQGMYWIGGSDGNSTHDGLYRIGPDLSPELIADTQRPTVYAGAASDDNSLYLIAGATDATDLTTATPRTLIVSLETGQASPMADYPGGGIILPAATYIDGHILVFGGATFDDKNNKAVNSTNAYSYSIKNQAWRKLHPVPFARRGMFTFTLGPDKILIGGGYGSAPGAPGEDFRNDCVVYSISKDRYDKAQPLPYAAMGQVAISHKLGLLLIGGEDKMKSRTPAFYINREQRQAGR